MLVEVSGESANKLLHIVIKKDIVNKKTLDFIILYFIDFTFITQQLKNITFLLND